jgi:dipeptidase D
MTSALIGIEPKEIWKHFDALAKIPRASTKEAAASEYVRAQADHLGLEVMPDRVGNLVIRKPAHAGREAAPMTILQGHLDMVCEKNEGTAHDFDTDAIQIVRDGDWLRAEGTTLGADNGIGVSAALAVMESKDINHGPLELVFTIDEESGLTGASEFPAGMLKSKYFLNLDSEETGTICIGCAGGIKTTGWRRISQRAPGANAAWRVKVSGLKGGHSGVDIHLGRGNALRILGGILQGVIGGVGAEISDIKGGSAQNAIPREASASLVLDEHKAGELRTLIANAESDCKADLGSFDPGLTISVERIQVPEKVISPPDAQRIADLLVSLPHGVLAMSPDVAGLTQNSTNLATVTTKNGRVEIVTSQRSALESSKQAAARMVATVFRLAGFRVEHTGSYPGWKPEPKSDIVLKLQAVHEKTFRQPAKLIAMHAGLECGVIGQKYPGMQMASFGPTIIDVHSPHERVQISTVQAFWSYLQAVLEYL